MKSRVIMIGDPTEFRIRRGANPHTRNCWGLRKHVDRGKAREQWQAMAETLSRYGLRIFVIPPDPEYPGLVFPANAGYTTQADIPSPLSRRSFILSNLNPARVGEGEIYRQFVNGLGLKVEHIHSCFEGEADLIRWNDQYLFTYGDLQKPHWVPRLGIPPWRRSYGFRSSHNAIHELAHWVPPDHVLAVRLINESYYHGDTLFCAFGSRRQYLLVYEKGVTPMARSLFRKQEGVIYLSDADAARFAANSFACQFEGNEILFMPAGISTELHRQIEALGVEVVIIDVSEFLEKGGGAVKCMIGDLGAYAPDLDVSPDVRSFREKHLFAAV